MAAIVLETVVHAPAERCFDLARSIDLHVATQKKNAEAAVGGRTSGLIDLGEEVTWSARHFGVRWRMTARITAFERGRSFRDEAVRGPFARFEHDHIFVPSGEQTIMIDRLAFESPFGPLGWLADRAFMRRHLTKLLAERAEAIRTCAETALGDRFLVARSTRGPSRPSSCSQS